MRSLDNAAIDEYPPSRRLTLGQEFIELHHDELAASTIGCIGQHYCVGHGRASSEEIEHSTARLRGDLDDPLHQLRGLGKVHHRFTKQILDGLASVVVIELRIEPKRLDESLCHLAVSAVEVVLAIDPPLFTCLFSEEERVVAIHTFASPGPAGLCAIRSIRKHLHAELCVLCRGDTAGARCDEQG